MQRPKPSPTAFSQPAAIQSLVAVVKVLVLLVTVELVMVVISPWFTWSGCCAEPVEPRANSAMFLAKSRKRGGCGSVPNHNTCLVYNGQFMIESWWISGQRWFYDPSGYSPTAFFGCLVTYVDVEPPMSGIISNRHENQKQAAFTKSQKTLPDKLQAAVTTHLTNHLTIMFTHLTIISWWFKRKMTLL